MILLYYTILEKSAESNLYQDQVTTLFKLRQFVEKLTESIAADIISYIRTLAIGSHLVSHEDRIAKAVNKVREMKEWNKIQIKWIDRFEKQLLKETVIRKEDLDKDPFNEAGGFKRLDKIFEHQLDDVLDTINDGLYTQIA